MDTFCVLVSVLGEDILMFLPMVTGVPLPAFALCVNSLACTYNADQSSAIEATNPTWEISDFGESVAKE